jgi:hypothetical protein
MMENGKMEKCMDKVAFIGRIKVRMKVRTNMEKNTEMANLYLLQEITMKVNGLMANNMEKVQFIIIKVKN